MRNGFWAGLDVGVTETSICVVDEFGAVRHAAACATEVAAVAERLAAFPQSKLRSVGVEAGPSAHLVRGLRMLGYPVAVFEVRQASAFLKVRRDKSDRNDANGLAELARLGGSVVRRVHVKSLACQNIRTYIAVRHKLIQQRLAIEGLLRSLVRLHGGRAPKSGRARSIGARLDGDLGHLTRDGISVEEDVAPMIAIADALRERIKALDRRLECEARANPTCRLLMTMPGIGPLTALSFYSAVEDPARFSTADSVGVYLGLTPVLKQSGAYLRQGGISKMGNKLTRTHLVNAASSMLTKVGTDSALLTWGKALRARMGFSRARVAVARKMAVVLLGMWKAGRPFEPYPQGNKAPA